MTIKPSDDLDAVRLIADALNPFEPADQERIIRWVRERVGLTTQQIPAQPTAQVAADGHQTRQSADARPRDIRTFVDTKKPQSDNQFSAVVAYYYRFEAPEVEQKADITADDLQDATRRAGRDRIARPAQTLVNAHAQGYLDKVERGRYSISTVGENLVAMALPQEAGSGQRRPVNNKRRVPPKRKGGSRKN